MGVPGFFAWILKKFKSKILVKNPRNIPEYLFIDANCLFHPECFKTLELYSNETNIDKLEKNMFKRIVSYLDYIEGFVNPTKIMYISVDGTAPLAKINQQRKRRYKSMYDNAYKNKIKTKYKIKYNNLWNNTCITPGTEFMEKLHKYLLKHYEEKEKKSQIKYIYSSYYTAGEGEHKILQYIKNNTNTNTNTNTNAIVIYGLDADLIFLSMASNKNNIYLLREEMHFNNQKQDKDTIAQDLIYVSIDETKNAYNEVIFDMFDKFNLIKPKEKNLTDDLIFICFLLGNDFLPHFPSININHEGLDEILNSYVECVSETGEVIITHKQNEIIINNKVFISLLEKMGQKEEFYFKSILPRNIEYFKRKKFIGSTETEYNKKIWEFENLKNLNNSHDPVKLGVGNSEDWKFRYYEHYFYTSESENQKELIKELSIMYIEGIKWVSLYYFEKCNDWKWQYPYNHAPFISYLAQVIKYYKININDLFPIQFDKDKNEPIPMYAQLISVLPPACNNLLPEKYRTLISNTNIKDLFPIKFEIDTLYKTQHWQCDPILPCLDIERILCVIKF